MIRRSSRLSKSPAKVSSNSNIESTKEKDEQENVNNIDNSNVNFSNETEAMISARILNDYKLCLDIGIQDIKELMETKLDLVAEKLQRIHEENSNKDVNSTQRSKKDDRKVFRPRESILSAMLDNSDENYRTIFNIALVALFLW